jgi:hypothetical protein
MVGKVLDDRERLGQAFDAAGNEVFDQPGPNLPAVSFGQDPGWAWRRLP